MSNIVSGNGNEGIILIGDSKYNWVLGNRIGTNFAGTASLGRRPGYVLPSIRHC